MNPEDVKTERRSVSISVTLRKRADLLARKKGVTTAELLRTAIDSYVTEALMRESVLDRVFLEDIESTQQASGRINPHMYG